MNLQSLPVTASVSHAELANAVRTLTIDSIEAAKSGHPGMPMGMADVATVLFAHFLRFDPSAPSWVDRDRFVLSAGHGSMLQYALLHLTGYGDMPLSELRQFRKLGSRTAGHPEHGHASGIETTTGPLGQGLGTAVGMAIAERMLNERFGGDLIDHYTYVIAGDGCLMEGISQEAIDLAGHFALNRLIVFWDDNGISIDGPTSLSTSVDQLARFRASGWRAERIDGHSPQEIAEAIARAKTSDRPSLIACRTIIGFGSPNLQGSERVHGAPLGEVEVAATRKALGWVAPAFSIPESIKAAWLAIGSRGRVDRDAWQERLAQSAVREAFLEALSNDLPNDVYSKIREHKRQLFRDRPSVATRKASESVLSIINAATERTVGGSADLTHSNLTITKGLAVIKAKEFGGRYIHYGVREHAMAAVMNGIALHGGFIPYGGTFLVFADYARAGIRLSALMKQRVVYVLTHDSIGLGEDGPTHQPIEHLAMLRATPNLNVFRPADAIETAECWELALRSQNRPSVLCLSRQPLPVLREIDTYKNLSARGAYVLRETDGPRDVTLIATGSEVEIAIEAASLLAEQYATKAAVVSIPCWELFEEQPEIYQRKVLGASPRVAVEAAARLGWDRWLGKDGAFIGMHDFGASAPAADLYRHFGITPTAVAQAAMSTLCIRGAMP